MSGRDKALPCCCELAIGTFDLLWAYIDKGDGIMISFRLIQYSNPYAIMNIVPIYHPCPPDASHAGNIPPTRQEGECRTASITSQSAKR